MEHPLLQFWEISLTRPTDLSYLISEPANRSGFDWQGYGIYNLSREGSIESSKCWGTVVPAWVPVFSLECRGYYV